MSFNAANFTHKAYFEKTCFNKQADFSFAVFNNSSSFDGSSFADELLFRETIMSPPANFYGVNFCRNTVWAGLKNEILCPMVKFLTRGRRKCLRLTVTDFSQFNTATMIEGNSNPYLKRYIDDEQWITSWRSRSKMCGFLFYIWELSSHCGRSFSLWAIWSMVFVIAFAFTYWGLGCDHFTYNVTVLQEHQPSLLGYFYYSIVTITTLGFGDIVPKTDIARVIVAIEVILGYIMLGGLISIFANKFARRS